MGFEFIPVDFDPDFGSWEQYFGEYARQRKLWLAERGGFDAVEDEDGIVTLVEREKAEKGRLTTIVEPRRSIEFHELGRSPKGLATALQAMGWTVQCWMDVAEVEPKLYLHDSSEGDANQHRAGDVLYEGYTARRYCVEARFGTHPVGIQAFYLGKGMTDDKGRPTNSASFVYCRIRDSAYGMVQIDTMDYTRTRAEADEKGWSNERRIQEGMAMNRRYPAEAHKVHAVHYTAADPMNRWVDFYLDLTKTEGPRLTRKSKDSQAVDKPVDDLTRMKTTGEWQG